MRPSVQNIRVAGLPWHRVAAAASLFRPPFADAPIRGRAAALVIVFWLVLTLAGCNMSGPPVATPLLLTPDSQEMNRTAPAVYRVRMETTKGVMVWEVHRDWSPHGADRFYNLVRAGYYDQSKFFRVMEGKWAQFGISGNPQVATLWRTHTIPDDPRKVSNTRGTVAFAFAVPNGRTTQVFINLRDNAGTHDAEPFVPFGRIIEGMEVADKLNGEYGENAGGGIRAGKQGPLFEQGNAYLEGSFPRLDAIVRATIVTTESNISRALIPSPVGAKLVAP